MASETAPRTVFSFGRWTGSFPPDDCSCLSLIQGGGRGGSWAEKLVWLGPVPEVAKEAVNRRIRPVEVRPGVVAGRLEKAHLFQTDKF